MPSNEGRGPRPNVIEAGKSMTLSQALVELRPRLARLPDTDDLKIRAAVFVEEADDMLLRLRGGNGSDLDKHQFAADVKRARELRGILQHFSATIDERVDAQPADMRGAEKPALDLGPQRRYLQELRQRIHALSNDVDPMRQPTRSRGVNELYQAIDLLDQLIGRATSADMMQNIQSGLDSIAARLTSLEQSYGEYHVDPKQIIDRTTPHSGYEREPHVVAPAEPVATPVTPVIATPERSYSDRYAEEQATRQRYEELLNKRTELETQLSSWKSIFRRGDLRLSLESVQRNLARYEEKFPFVKQPRSLSSEADRRTERDYQMDRLANTTQHVERLDATNKVVALERADTKLELDVKDRLMEIRSTGRVANPEDYRLSSTRAMEKLTDLFHQAPKNWKAYQEWSIKVNAAEGYLPNLFNLGSKEQHQVTDYWAKKIYLLEQVKPLVFGRSAWQAEYDRAWNARRAAIHEGQMRRAA